MATCFAQGIITHIQKPTMEKKDPAVRPHIHVLPFGFREQKVRVVIGWGIAMATTESGSK